MNKRYIASVLGAMTVLLAAGAVTATAATPPGVQAASQSATNAQQASAASEATQINPSNTNISVRVLSPGNDGPVTQTNSVSSNASATNSNSADQNASQSQGSGGGIQVSDQSAKNAQLATAWSSAFQYGATNTNIPVRVLSPGNSGSVTQSNDASSTASSTNSNYAHQSGDQSQAGGSSCGCAPAAAPIQTADQSAASGQAGAALSATGQKDPANDSAPTGVESAGGGGITDQSNSADSTAGADNSNSADQSSDQSQAGSGSGIQTSDQSAKNEQVVAAASSASQEKPKNTNISVRVLSPGNDGAVTQTNSVSSDASASNDNSTEQKSDQDQAGPRSQCGCNNSPVGIQTSDQSAKNEQGAVAASAAFQSGAENVNTPVRVLSPGNGGKVEQSNSVSSKASSSNDNSTEQSADQDQSGTGGCGCQKGDPTIQTSDQSSSSEQAAGAFSIAKQEGAKNENSPVRVGSTGNDGGVSQSNSASSDASASNDNGTDQDADQSDPSSSKKCGCDGGLGIQVLGQDAENEQASFAASAALQVFDKSECGCHSGGNSNDPVRVWSRGDDGSVSQSNSADSNASADNSNETEQSADQRQSGGSGIAIQALGQEAENKQLAAAFSATFQLDPSNDNSPTRVYSPGNGGSVKQSNDASSDASAENSNDTDQTASQSQHGSSGCGCGSDPLIQALGQSASSRQAALVFSKTFQLKPRNANDPTSVWSFGNGGASTQRNDDSSDAEAENRNEAEQLARQSQA